MCIVRVGSLNIYIQKLSGTGRAVALVFNGIQRSRTQSVNSWCPSSYEDILLFLWVEVGMLLLKHSDNLSASLQTKDLCTGKLKQ